MDRHFILLAFLLVLALVGDGRAVPKSRQFSVRQSAAPAKCKDADCCTLSEAILTECAAAGASCLTGAFSIMPKFSCQNCPVGQCRVGTHCACPTKFLGSGRLRRSCIASHTRVYPDSVGLADASRRKCRPSTESPVPIPAQCHRRACCEMTFTELNVCHPQSDRCRSLEPGLVSLRSVCEDCSPGECRLGQDCFCPNDFLRYKNLRAICATTHGKEWIINESPASSADDRDRANGACKKLKERSTNGTGSEPSPVPAAKERRRAGPTAKPVQDNKSRKMTAGELWGIVFGGVGALAGVAGVVVTIVKRYEFVEMTWDASSYPIDS